jgi:hypothetical protein
VLVGPPPRAMLNPIITVSAAEIRLLSFSDVFAGLPSA